MWWWNVIVPTWGAWDDVLCYWIWGSSSLTFRAIGRITWSLDDSDETGGDHTFKHFLFKGKPYIRVEKYRGDVPFFGILLVLTFPSQVTGAPPGWKLLKLTSEHPLTMLSSLSLPIITILKCRPQFHWMLNDFGNERPPNHVWPHGCCDAYGLNDLIFDLGGATFDILLLLRRVILKAWWYPFGGEDFDNNHFAQEYAQEFKRKKERFEFLFVIPLKSILIDYYLVLSSILVRFMSPAHASVLSVAKHP